MPEKVLVVDVNKEEIREEERDIVLPPPPTAPLDPASNDQVLVEALMRVNTLEELKQALMPILGRLGIRSPSSENRG